MNLFSPGGPDGVRRPIAGPGRRWRPPAGFMRAGFLRLAGVLSRTGFLRLAGFLARTGFLRLAGFLAALLLVSAVPAAGWDRGMDPAQAPVSGYEPEWSWPLSPDPPVIRPFQAPPQRWLAGHRGVDLSAPPGAAVLSPAAGTVAFAGWVVNRPVMTVDFGGGLLASFEPVHPEKAVGDPVSEGEVLGRLAGEDSAVPGHCASSCLHWGVRLNREYVNPLGFVTDRRPSVLLPLR